MTISGWIGVDLDGTLAEYNGWISAQHIGKPIPAMVEKVNQKLAEGVEVKIFTARVCVNNAVSPTSGDRATKEFALQQERYIKDWCEEHLGKRLEVTCVKDFACIEIWDDRAKQVILNKGVFYGEEIGSTLNLW